MRGCEFLIVGAGMAGASAGFALAPHGRVIVLERESQPGYHTTGRSAALFSETYGNATIRGLSSGGRGFYLDPPPGFAEHPLLTPRGAMFVGRADQMAALEAAVAEVGDLDRLAPLDAAAARRLVPVLRPDYLAGAVIERAAMDIDVAALHQGYLRGLRAEGGRLVVDAGVRAAAWDGGRWRVETAAGEFASPVLINAAGTWCDEIAALAGAAPVGLVAKRRTIITFEPPADVDVGGWPLVVDVDEEFYFKPDAGRLLGSPADETPSPPCDARPDELDMALAVDRIERATVMRIGRILNRWAGLRSFVADNSPVAGFDDAADGFFWLAGQGGYGIQTAPGLGRTVAALARGKPIPADLQDLGVKEMDLAPHRLRRSAAPTV